jgi:hypothetical protein
VAKKKKNKGRPPAPVPPSPPRFNVGDRVRVRPGVSDPDYSDIPWSGWAGVVDEVQARKRSRLYAVRWSPETLAAGHPVYFLRCKLDGTEPDLAWLEEKDLEPDPGTPVTIEQPTRLIPPPLDLRNPLELARHILGVTRDDELPPFTPEGMARFHAYLVSRVQGAMVLVDEQGYRNVNDVAPGMVLRLLPLTPEMGAADLLLDVKMLEGGKVEMPISEIAPLPGTPSATALKAYLDWINDAEEEGDESEQWQESARQAAPAGWERDALRQLGQGMLLACLMGTVLVSLVWAMPSTHLAALIGACMLGVVGALLGGGAELKVRKDKGLRANVAGGGLLGLLGGAFLGATLGALVIAGLGALGGAFVGLMLSGLLKVLDIRWPGVPRLVLVGTAAGAVFWAFANAKDGDLALAGLWRGALGGLAMGVIVLFGGWYYFGAVMPPTRRASQEGERPEEGRASAP